MPIMHSLEHFLGDYMREACDAVITVAPMGCQTGFYIVATIAEFDRMERLLAEVLQAITSAESVPHADVIHCGWAASHTVDGARTVAAWLLTHRAEWADVGPSAIEV
jgi:S-ribosylhomocysteine lyase